MRRRLNEGLAAAVCDDEGGVERRRERAAAWCVRWLSLHLAARTPRPCAVFDLDSTLLAGEAPIPSMCRLHEWCHRAGVTVFWVTARASTGKRVTMEQMVDGARLTAPRHIFMHPVDTPLRCAADAARQKERARRRIAERAYTLVLNVGDQAGDHTPDASHVPGRIRRDDVGVYVDADGCAHVKLPTVRAAPAA